MDDGTARAKMGFRYGYADDALALGSLGNVCVAHWRGLKTRERARHERMWLDRVAMEHPRCTLALFVIAETAPPLDDEMRQAAADTIRARARDLAGVAVVIEGTGFRGALIRALLTAIESVLGAHAFPSKYFAEVPRASAWLGTLGARADSARITELAELLRDARGARLAPMAASGG